MKGGLRVTGGHRGANKTSLLENETPRVYKIEADANTFDQQTIPSTGRRCIERQTESDPVLIETPDDRL